MYEHIALILVFYERINPVLHLKYMGGKKEFNSFLDLLEETP